MKWNKILLSYQDSRSQELSQMDIFFTERSYCVATTVTHVTQKSVTKTTTSCNDQAALKPRVRSGAHTTCTILPLGEFT